MPNMSVRRTCPEHVLDCNKEDQKFNLKDERGKDWEKIVEIYRKNKQNRSRRRKQTKKMQKKKKTIEETVKGERKQSEKVE